MKSPKLTLILPCFNESEHFETSMPIILDELKNSKITFEIILIDDKSTDSTIQLIKKFVKHNLKYRIHSFFHKNNCGRGYTVSEGILKAEGEYVGYIDIDCEVSPSYIPLFINKLNQGYDVVCADRKYKTIISGWLRAFLSKAYASLIKKCLPLSVSDSEAGYKFFKRKKIIPIITRIKSRRWFWDTELMVRSNLKGLKISSISVPFIRRQDKTSTVKILSDSIDYIMQIIRLRRDLSEEAFQQNKASTNEKIISYWHQNSPAFSNQYKSFLGMPLSWVGLFLHQRYKCITFLLNSIPGKIFLDIGCGSGIFLKWAISHNFFAYGIDYSEQMLDLSKKNLRSYSNNDFKLIRAKATQIPLKDKSVDIILASGLTDYLTNKETYTFFQEIKRILKPEGYAIVTFPKQESPLSFLRSGFGLWIRKNFLHLPPMKTEYTKEQSLRLFYDAKLQPIKIQDVMFTMRIVMGKKYVR
jgi:ubiquinone/menaquinone biosynthesis C-methylase UbiE